MEQHRATSDIDFSNPLRGSPGYDSSKDVRRPGRAHGDGVQPKVEEDQPVIEDHNEVLERLTKEAMRQGKTYAKAMSDAADDPAFKAAFAAYKARKYGV